MRDKQNRHVSMLPESASTAHTHNTCPPHVHARASRAPEPRDDEAAAARRVVAAEDGKPLKGGKLARRNRQRRGLVQHGGGFHGAGEHDLAEHKRAPRAAVILPHQRTLAQPGDAQRKDGERQRSGKEGGGRGPADERADLARERQAACNAREERAIGVLR
jgi:hypothetical protein